MDAIQRGHYVYPPERHPHRGTILAYPSDISLPANLLAPVRAEILNIAAAISCFEAVSLYVRPEDLDDARAHLVAAAGGNPDNVGPITLVPFPVHHCWVRDTGPVFVHSADPADRARYAINFRFNEWGGKLPGVDDGAEQWGQVWPALPAAALAENHAFAASVIEAETERVVRIDAPISLEGGGLDVDGEGTLLACESSTVCGVRNPGQSRDELEAELRRLLGVQKVIWLPGVRGADITDCHVDALARFVRPGVVVMERMHGAQEQVWLDVYETARRILEEATDARGRRLEIVELEGPDPTQLVQHDGEDPECSYTNYYVVNSGVVGPKFGIPESDARALETMRRLFPGREVKQVFINALPRTGGGIHCCTQQVPFAKVHDHRVEHLEKKAMAFFEKDKADAQASREDEAALPA
jgi:agmatine deiminase